MPPPNYNFRKWKKTGNLLGIFFFALLLISCTEEQNLPEISQIETLQSYFGKELSNKTTFENIPIELDWDRAHSGEHFIEVPLVTPIVAFKLQSLSFESRLIIPRESPEKYTFISLEANFDLQSVGFKEIISQDVRNRIIAWLELDKEYNSLGFHKFNTYGNQNMKMDEGNCTTMYYYERTCYYNGSSLVGCTAWELMDSYEVCNGEVVVAAFIQTT